MGTLYRVLALALCIWGMATLPALGFAEGKVLWDAKKSRYIYEAHFIRVIYTLTGEGAVNPHDADANAIPDQVEDIAKQIWAAHRVFCVLYGFTEPLGSARYPATRYIEVYTRPEEKMVSKDTGKASRGFAFQKAQRAQFVPDTPDTHDTPKGEQALIIAVIHTLDPLKNSTPTHEFFHLVQNASTRITTGWYFEGMARWSQDATSPTHKKAQPQKGIVPRLGDAYVLETLNGISYDAAWTLWYPLAFAVDTQPEIPLHPDDPLRTLTYSDGSLVLKDTLLPGARLMRLVLHHLALQQPHVEALPAFISWDKNRRDTRNSPYILKAIQDAVYALQKEQHP